MDKEGGGGKRRDKKGGKEVKTTVVIRFDGTAFLHHENKTLSFHTYDELKEYVAKENINIEIYHSHPAGIKVEVGNGSPKLR